MSFYVQSCARVWCPGSGGVEKIPSVQKNVLAKRRLVAAGQQPSQASCPLLLYPNTLEMILCACQITFLLCYFLRIQSECWKRLQCFSWRFSEDIIETCLFVIWAPPRVLHIVLHSHWPQRLASARLQRSAVSHSSLPSKRYQVWVVFYCVRDSFIAFCVDPSGSRGLSVSRVSQQDLEQVLCFMSPPPMLSVFILGYSMYGVRIFFATNKSLDFWRINVTLDWINGWWKFSSAIRGNKLQTLKSWSSVREKLCVVFEFSVCVCSCRVTWRTASTSRYRGSCWRVEGLYSKTRSRHTFIQALTAQIRGLVHHAKRWTLIRVYSLNSAKHYSFELSG